MAMPGEESQRESNVSIWIPILFLVVGVVLIVCARPLATRGYELYKDAPWWYPKPPSISYLHLLYRLCGIIFVLLSLLVFVAYLGR